MIIKTKYGLFRMHAVDKNTVCVDANENCGGDPNVGLTYFGVRYGVHGFLRKIGEKFFVRERSEDELYMARATPGGGEPSHAARKAAIKMLEEEVNKWITEPDLIKAGIQSNEDDIRRKTEKIMEKAEEIGQLEKELGELVAYGKRLEGESNGSCL